MSNRTEELFKQCAIVDFETNSVEPSEAEIIESALTMMEDGKWITISKLHKPKNLIPPESSAINNITDKDVVNCEPFEEYVDAFLETSEDASFFVAHNVTFDNQVFANYSEDTRPWICTMRLAKLLYSDDDTVIQYTLPYLRYRFNIPLESEYPPHRAGSDSELTANLFTFLVAQLEVNELLDNDRPYGDQILELMERPIILKIMPFGKHRGKEMTSVPIDYWLWAINNMSQLQEDSEHFDRDLLASVDAAIESMQKNS